MTETKTLETLFLLKAEWNTAPQVAARSRYYKTLLKRIAAARAQAKSAAQ